MKRVYWTIESWGNGYPPENVFDVIDSANNLIDEYARANPDLTADDLHDYSNALWDDFCNTGRVGDVVAVYADDE